MVYLEKATLVIALCLCVVLALGCFALTILWRGEVRNKVEVIAIANQQNQNVQTFTTQLQRCQDLSDVDLVLGQFGIERAIIEK